jgi:hypothetical protein
MSAEKPTNLKNMLPEFQPKANLWDEMMEKQSLDAQVRTLVSELPIHQPKAELWANIQAGLNRKKLALIWYGGIAASIIMLLGISALFLFSSRNSALDKKQLSILENIRKEDPISTSPPQSTELEGVLEMEVAITTHIDNTNNQVVQLEKLSLLEKGARKDRLNLPFQTPIVPFPEKTITWDNQDILQERKLIASSSKREIIIQWDTPMRRVRLDGFIVRLTEEEWQSLQESNKSKKGFLKLPELVARTPEK